LQDLWALIDWVNPGLLGDRKRFQTLFRTPIEKHEDIAAQFRLNRRLYVLSFSAAPVSSSPPT